MKKLKLTLESLAVEQFAPQELEVRAGTVAGQELFTTCGPWFCPIACDSREGIAFGADAS